MKTVGDDEGGTERYQVALGELDTAAWAFEDADGRLVEVNPAFCALLGLADAPAALIGDRFRTRLNQLARLAQRPGDVTRLFDRLRCAVRGAGDVQFADGRICEVQCAPVELPAGARGHVWRFVDVTIARTHVAALRDAVASAEKANDGRRAFLAGLSHELRTPVNAVIGMSELAAEMTLDGDLAELVTGVERNARRLLNLIERLLAFAGGGAPVDSLSPAPFSPIALIDAVASGHVGDTGPMLLCRRGPDVPRRVVGDRAGLSTLLQHLLGFAVDVDHGLVELGVDCAPGGRPAQGEADAPQETLRFFVRDTVDRTAVDEPEAVLDEVFWRAGGVAEEVGVGRQIVLALVGRVGGELRVRHTPEGTLFEVICPLVVERGPDRREPLAGRRVLIADPHPERRALHAEQCLEWGAAIRTAADADALRDALMHEPIDLALVADPLLVERGDLPWVRVAAPGQLDVQVESCIWRVGPTPRQDELLAAFERCLAAEEADGAGSARVLVVEDLVDNALVVRRFLEAAGHRVEVAATGARALRAIRSDAWDIVLMDINLPDIDGLEVTRRMRAFEARARLGQTPAVALSAYATDSVRDRAAAAGLRTFLTKPVDRQVLLDAVARHGRRGPVGLIVDSDPVGRLLLMRRARRRASLRLRWAADAAEARRIATRESVAFAVIDSALSDGDGLPLARWMCAEGVRCALVIDRDERPLREQAIDAGCDAVLAKPVAATEVARVLARLCRDTGALAPIRPRRRSSSPPPEVD